jgi:biopolymer transport protein ExbB/TolQ
MAKIIILLALIGLLLGCIAWAQSGTDTVKLNTAQTANGSTGDIQKEVTPKVSFNGTKLLNECEQFKWPLILTLLFGLMLGLYQGYLLFAEAKKSKPLAKMSFGQSSPAQIAKELNSPSGASELGRSLRLLFNSFLEGERGEDDYHNEVTLATQVRKERFQTFRNWETFFSDSAGALGLLGTVAGIYITFMSGNLNAELVLRGMALALATTLVGLVNSLIINLTTMGLSNIFDRQMELTYKKMEELRFALKKHKTGDITLSATGSQS